MHTNFVTRSSSQGLYDGLGSIMLIIADSPPIKGQNTTSPSTVVLLYQSSKQLWVETERGVNGKRMVGVVGWGHTYISDS